RLALLARHLVPGDASADEDLVQGTFLVAIRSAPRFTPGRPVLPWLVTILARRAANLRRDRGRRTRRIAGDDAVLAELCADGPDPARLAADAEAAAEVASAVERLEPPYREVVALRLIHGLGPGEIVRALGRPLGTVHVERDRRVERLRRMLPAGLALALTGRQTAAPSFAAARAAVLDAARRTPWALPVSGGAVGV